MNEAHMDEGIAGQLARIIARLAEIERKLDRLAEPLGVSLRNPNQGGSRGQEKGQRQEVLT